MKNLRFDYDFEAFFPNEDEELEVYHKYRETFDFDNEFVLISAENRSGIFRKGFLEKIQNLTDTLKQLNHVQQVISPSTIKTVALGDLLPVQKRILHIEDESLYKDDSTSIYRSGQYVGSFFPKNGKSLSIYIKTENQLSKLKSDSLANSILTILEQYKFDDIHYVGRIFAQKVYLENLQNEFVTFFVISFGLIVLFLWISFRKIIGVIIPVTIVLIAILWTLAIMHVTGKSIDIMTVMLPTMMFVAGMSDSVHFFSKYYDELERGKSPDEIYKLLFKEVGLPTFLTTLTTVVGFLSLTLSSIKPIRDFGLYTSIGVSIALILSYTLLPALLMLINPKPKQKSGQQKSVLFNWLQKLIHIVFRKQGLIVVTTVVICVLSVFGLRNVRINNVLLEDLTDKVKIKQDFNYFDSSYSGVRPFELLVTCTDSSEYVWDENILKQLNKVDAFIREEFNAGFVISLPQVIKSVQSELTDSVSYFPEGEDLRQISEAIQKNRKSKLLRQIITSDGKQTRISAKTRDIGSINIRRHVKKLKEFLKENTNPSQLSFEITGAAHLVDRNNQYMVKSMATGFGLSVIVISILTFFLHRSWKMVLVFVIPNLIPLLIIAGVMGFLGIELKAATALVFSIAFGIATDDTIHFISRLKIEMGYGKSLLYAFKRTYFETGRPIVLTTFILCGGFVALMTSNFQSTFYFGFLICITIFVALLADLFVLPVLLFMLYGRKPEK